MGGAEEQKQLEMGEASLQRPASHRWDMGSLGLKPDRAAEGAAGSSEGHGGDVTVTTRR